MNINNVDPNLGSAPAGSPAVPPTTPNQGDPGGETNKTGGENGDNSKAYDDLVSRFGTQGQELGEYRQFFQNIAPLLDKLDQSPELVQAIIDGKVDKDIAQAVMEGRVDVRDAAIVQQANESVKEKLGDKAYNLATPDSVAKLVEAEVSKFRKEFEEKADLEKFQDYSQKFIENTKDFQEYADDIDKWLDTHEVTDIEVAYYAVKGKMSEEKAKKAAEIAEAERAKEILSNAPGGGNTAQFSSDGTPMVDKLIAGRPNPNTFFGG
ncbi:MAG: hypothetical protein WC917_04080 [Bacilli bacterium]|jgi:hypothetical protein